MLHWLFRFLPQMHGPIRLGLPSDFVYVCVIPAQEKPVLLFTFSLSCADWLFLARFIRAL